MRRVVAFAFVKTVFIGWLQSWLFLLWSAACVAIGAALALSAFGTAMIALLRSRGLL